MQYFKNIGKTFTVKGFNESRIVKIKEFYCLGNNSKYPAYKCEVIGNYKHFKNGDRENFLCKDVIKNDNLISEIKCLTA